eukprot:TRINITY_DN819_c0_g2_i1.p1 TRINITY_DN819_c0_g2~~TRINITY_DN819_c0_g2_i1.p1  ORF type:complete len:285 (-),score=79.62 TRINITY_DN819_c0_g2_i1:189-1043(-)
MACQRLMLIGIALFGSQASAAVVRGADAPLSPLEHAFQVADQKLVEAFNPDQHHAKVAQPIQLKQAPLGGMRVPVLDDQVKLFLKELSPECKKQYTFLVTGAPEDFDDMGTGSGYGQVKSFGMKNAEDAASCRTASGVQCEEEASMSARQNTKGIAMKHKKTLSGKTCIPKNCLKESDLKALSSFLQTQVVQFMNLGSMTLKFDCSKVGGDVAMATTGGGPVAMATSGGGPKEDDKDDDKKEESKPKAKSAAQAKPKSELNKGALSVLVICVGLTAVLVGKSFL